MLDERTNIYEYEQLLMGQRNDFQISFKGNAVENRVEVGNIWRYAITKLLGWTPQEALKYLTNEIVDALLLNKTFVGLNYDREHTFIADYRFILQYAFPKEIKYDMYAEAIAEYERVAKLGIWKNDKSNYKFPKSFFTDENGPERAKILFRYAVNIYLGDTNPDDRYKFFANKSRATRWINAKKLSKPLKVMYESPLEFYHDAIPFREKDEFLYRALLLKDMCDVVEENLPDEEDDESEEI